MVLSEFLDVKFVSVKVVPRRVDRSGSESAMDWSADRVALVRGGPVLSDLEWITVPLRRET